MEKLADFILGNRKAIFILSIVLALAAIYPALNIKTDFSLEGFFPQNDLTITKYRDFSEEFGRDDNIIFIGIESQQLFSKDVLNDIKKLADSLSGIPYVVDVRSIWDANRLQNRNDNLVSESWLDSSLINSFTVDEFSTLKKEITADPFLEGLLVNKQGTFTAIVIEIDELENSFPIREIVIAEMRDILEPFQGSYEIYIAGIPYFRNQYIHLLNGEIIFYISISSVLIILLLWFLFRQVQGILIPILIVWLTILFTLAVLQLTGGYFEVLTSSIAPILLCVGIADSVHMLAKYNDGRFVGLTRGKAIRESLLVLGSATFLTSVTTAIGFATLITSNVIPMRTFGLYTAAGVMIAYVITIFLLPSMAPLFKDQSPVISTQGRIHSGVGNFLLFVFGFAQRNHKSIVIGTLIITALTSTGISQLRVNGYVFDDVGRDSPLVNDSNIISEKLSPQFPLEIVIDTGQENGITDPDLLERIEALETELENFPEIEKTLSLTTVLREIHRVMSPEDAQSQPLPNRRDLIAQYILLAELTDTDALESFTDFSYQKIRVATQTYDVGSNRINDIRDELHVYISEHFPNETITMTGTTILVADLTDNIVYSLASSIGLAFLFISLIMAWLFRNARLVIISLLPNLMPLIIVAGVMGFFGIDIKPSTAVIFTIAFGIAVDDSIHFLARFRIETRRGRNLVEAIRYTTEKTGRAIVLTSAILIVGFGTLGFSDFESTMLMGRLVCLTIFVAIIADLFFLPALIYWLKPQLDTVRATATNK